MKRELGIFERALVISDQHAPFHMVCVLRLEGTPSPKILKQALRSLQNHHPFLKVHLLKEKGRYYFETLQNPGIPFHVLPRWNDEHWAPVAEVELGTRMDVTSDPLFRCTYLFNANQKNTEIILTFFHPILDAASAGQLMHELLTTCTALMNEKTVTVFELPPNPPVESRFPSAYRGLRLSLQTLRYVVQQISDEISYRVRTRNKRIPPLLAGTTRGHFLSIQLPENLVDSLSRRARLENVTFNTLLNTAMLIAVNRHLYAGKYVPMRTFSFVDLRPYVEPPLPNENLACYISMLRFTVSVEGGIDFWHLAHQLQLKIYRSLKSGDKFVAATMSESLLKMVTRLKSFRMGSTALNYNGVSQIQPNYGAIKVRDIHGYVSAYDLGPELSGQAQLFNDKLIWDFVYLDADMSRDEAKAIVEEIKSILNSSIQSPIIRI